MWVYIDTSSVVNPSFSLVGKTNSNLPGPFDFYLHRGGSSGPLYPRFFWGNGVDEWDNYTSSVSVPEDKWVNIAVVTQGFLIKFYLDGNLIDSGTILTVPKVDSGTDLKILARDNLNIPFQGKFNMCTIYKTDLSDDEIKRHFIGTKKRF